LTKKLYREDAYLFEFVSEVTSVVGTDAGYEVILEATAFYPEAGGQRCDLGRLNDHEVVDVFEDDRGRVVHRLKSWSGAAGETVRGVIDRARRLAHMRQHTGQHILSQAFLKVAGARTISSHLGEREATIELSEASLDDDVIDRAERTANGIVLEDRPITTGEYERGELSRLPMRKVPDIPGPLRVVAVDGFDYTACGGTHCRRTGEVGPVKIIGREKIRGHLRVLFLTGHAAIEDYVEKHRVVAALMQKLTCHHLALESSLDKILEHNTELKKEITTLVKRLLPTEVAALKSKADEISGIGVSVAEYPGRDLKEMREIALELVSHPGHMAVLISGDRLLVAVSDGVKPDARRLADAIMKNVGGKGGGSSVLAQVGAIAWEDRINPEEWIKDIVRSELSR